MSSASPDPVEIDAAVLATLHIHEKIEFNELLRELLDVARRYAPLRESIRRLGNYDLVSTEFQKECVGKKPLQFISLTDLGRETTLQDAVFMLREKQVPRQGLMR